MSQSRIATAVNWRLKFIYIYITWPLPQFGASQQHKENNKTMFHSVLLAMTKDPAEFGWHCWSNTAHPPLSSTTYVTIYLPPPLPQGCLWQQQMPIRTASQSFATYFYSLHAHLPHPSSYHSGLFLLHPSTQTYASL